MSTLSCKLYVYDFSFTTKWSDNEGVNEEDNGAYLEEFCQTFEKAMILLIDKEAQESIPFRNYAGKDQSQHMQICYTEILEHAHQCELKVSRFHGRKDILSSIESYLTSDSNQPFVVYGESGCGKTSVLAKIAKQVNML